MEPRRARKAVTYVDAEEDDDFGVSAVDRLPQISLPAPGAVESIMALKEPEDGTDPSLPIEPQLTYFVKYRGCNFASSEWKDGETLVEQDSRYVACHSSSTGCLHCEK